MPQASKELQDRWDDDAAALAQLRGNFTVTRGGVILPNRGYQPTPDDMSAVDYLIYEWDYGYEPRDVTDANRCPLCKSEQVEVCIDANNEAKSLARCRQCKCTAPLANWNRPRLFSFNTLDRLTREKAAHIIDRDGFIVTGVVMTKPGGECCIVDKAAVRWISSRELFRVMHPSEE